MQEQVQDIVLDTSPQANLNKLADKYMHLVKTKEGIEKQIKELRAQILDETGLSACAKDPKQAGNQIQVNQNLSIRLDPSYDAIQAGLLTHNEFLMLQSYLKVSKSLADNAGLGLKFKFAKNVFKFNIKRKKY